MKSWWRDRKGYLENQHEIFEAVCYNWNPEITEKKSIIDEQVKMLEVNLIICIIIHTRKLNR